MELSFQKNMHGLWILRGQLHLTRFTSSHHIQIQPTTALSKSLILPCKTNSESWEPWMWAPTECKQINGLKRTGWPRIPSLILSSVGDIRTRAFSYQLFLYDIILLQASDAGI